MEKEDKLDKILSLPLCLAIAALVLSAAWLYDAKFKTPAPKNAVAAQIAGQKSELEEEVLPKEGVELPAVWADLGAKLVNAGVIDQKKFQALYESRGQFGEEEQKLLFGEDNGKLTINEENAGFVLNLLWALGLSNDNQILNDPKEMKNPEYGGAGKFASTGGWSLSMGDPMNHYGRHRFMELTAEQQALVDKVSRGVYRPCCGNSTHFPDCNHGMAMLGLLELMAYQGASEQEMWRAALAVNSYWFPDTYLTIAEYEKNRGVDWQDVNPQEVLGANYSSASGYQRIMSQVSSPSRRSGSCGV